MEAYTVSSGRVVVFRSGRKERVAAGLSMLRRNSRRALYRYLRSGANMLLAELVRRGDAEERGAGGVPRGRLRLKQQKNSSRWDLRCLGRRLTPRPRDRKRYGGTGVNGVGDHYTGDRGSSDA